MDDGEPNRHFEDPKALLCQQYFEAIDTVYGDLKNRFQQERGMPIAAELSYYNQQILLMKNISKSYSYNQRILKLNN